MIRKPTLSRKFRRNKSSQWQDLAVRRRFTRPAFERLEGRELLAFAVASANPFSNPNLKLTLNFDAPVNVATLAGTDLLIDGASSALTTFTVDDADTVTFSLPAAIAVGARTLSINAGAIEDTIATPIDAFSRGVTILSQNPRVQLGNAPLTGYTGSTLDQFDIMWATTPTGGGAGTYTVEYRLAGSSDPWTPQALNPAQTTNLDSTSNSRVVESATITGLQWYTNYEYRVIYTDTASGLVHNQYQATYKTRLEAGSNTNFSFAAYGDSAQAADMPAPPAAPSGFRAVQNRINQSNAEFAVLLGDNVYETGTFAEWDLRFSSPRNPEAAAWAASKVDYLGVGNHDVGNSSLLDVASLRGPEMEFMYSVPIPEAGLTAPASPPSTEFDEHNFSFDYGSVHFVTFDTNANTEDKVKTDTTRLDQLLDWVIADLNASTQPWKVVYGHHLIGGSPGDQGAFQPGDYYFQTMVTRLKAAGVDLFMAGHAHTYAWSYPLTGVTGGNATFVDRGPEDYFFTEDGLTELISGAGGVGLSGSSFPNFMARGWSSSTAIVGRDGFSLIDVTPTTMTVKYIAANDGTVMGQFTLNNQTPALLVRDDIVSTPKNNSTTISVLSNDVALLGTMSLQSVGTPSHGSVTNNGNGTITYTPAVGYVGSDSFTYTAADSSGSASATVNITVTPYSAARTFRQGANGYSGSVDTFLDNTNATTAAASQAALTQVFSDGDPLRHGLIRFDNLFGAGIDQVPLDATNIQATLTVVVNDDGTPLNFHRMLIDWVNSVTYTSAGSGTGGYNSTPGLQADGVEAVTTADLITGTLGATTHTFNVTNSILEWFNGTSSNYGWALLPSTTSGMAFISSEGTLAQRPQLTISFIANSQIAPLAQNDTVNTEINLITSIPILANDRDDNGDILTIDSVTLPAHGTAIAQPDKTILYTPTTGYIGPDSFSYTISDGNGNTSTATVSLTLTGPVYLNVEAAYLTVTQNNSLDTSSAVGIASSLASAGLSLIPANHSRGDYAVQIGATNADDVTGGVLLSSVSQSGRSYPIGDPACGATAAANCGAATTKQATSSVYTSGGGYVVSTSISHGVDSDTPFYEANQNVSVAYFPNASFKTGTFTTTAGGSPTLLPIATVQGAGPAIAPLTDGVLLVNSLHDGNTYAAATPTATGWNISRHSQRNGTNYVAGSVTWVWVPYSIPASSLIAGRVRANASSATGVPQVTSTPGSTVTATLTGTGIYNFSIAGHSPSTGVLLVFPENNNNASDNTLNFQASGSSWTVESRDLPAATTANPDTTNMGIFQFVYIPTGVPVEPLSAQLAIDASGNLTYASGINIANQLTITDGILDDGNLYFSDPNDVITLNSIALAAGWTGDGTNTVSGPVGSFSSLVISTGQGNDLVTLESSHGCLGCPISCPCAGGKPITITSGNQTGDALVMNVSVMGDSITFTGFNSITQAPGMQLLGTTVTLGANSIGTSSAPINTKVSTITATGGTGGVFLNEEDGVSVTFSATGAGNVQVTNQLGMLTVGGVSTAVSGNVSLSSADGINVNANINAGSGTITIAANTDGVGGEGFTQATTGSLTTTNATPAALSITVNTALGGTGDATVGVASATNGNYTVNVHGGSILWQTGHGAYTIPSIGGTAVTYAFHITASKFFLTSTGTGSIGSSTAPIQLNTPDSTREATLSAGSGGLFIADSTAGNLNVLQATATGAGDILLISNDASVHNLEIVGTVSTESGNIRMIADDNLNLYTNSVIGGPGFSGTVHLMANIDSAGGEQTFTMQGNSVITTSNTTANAVLIQVAGSTNATAVPTSTLGNITVGDGGTITVTMTPIATRFGAIAQLAGKVLDAGPLGSVILNALNNPIGTALLPIVVSAGNVSASTTSTTSTTNASQQPGSIFITADGASSMQATTTTAGTRVGAITLKTLAGVLTVGGTGVNTDSGTISLDGAAGVAVNAVIGDANQDGNVTIVGNAGDVDFTVSPATTVANLLTISSGTLQESVVAGSLSTRSLTIDTAADYEVDIVSTSSYDQVSVTGAVVLGGGDLIVSLDPGYVPVMNDEFTIVLNDTNSDLVTGTFVQGSTITVGAVVFAINYAGGDGNDVTLKVTYPGYNTPTLIATDPGSPFTVAEGSLLTVTGTWSDVDAGDVVGISSLSGGSVVKSGTNAGGTWTWTLTPPDGDVGPYIYTIEAVDGINTTTTTFEFSVTNVAPTLTISGNPSVNEGAPFTLNLASSDPGDDTIDHWTITWGDGSPAETVAGNPSSATHTYADGLNNYTISATATDEDGTFSSNTAGVQVDNVAPTLTISGSSITNEGAVYTLGLASSEPGNDNITQWDIDWGDGSPIETVPGNPSSATHTYADGNSSYVISATATDEDGTSGANPIGVSVNDVAPIINLSGNPTTTVGLPYSLTVSSIDPGSDTLTSWIVNWGDGTGDQPWNGSDPLLHTYTFSALALTINVTAFDEDGGPYAASMPVDVFAVPNVPPQVDTDLGSPFTVAEGSTLTVTGTWSDDNAGDNVIISVFSGGGSVTQGGTNASGTWSWSFAPLDGVSGPNTVVIEAFDGTVATTTSFVYNVTNVAPTVTISGASSVAEGSPYTLTLSATGDPGTDAITSWLINWGDGPAELVTGNPGTVSHTYADGVNNYSITATATDEDGTYAAGNTVAVTVDNVDPTLTINGASSINEGALYTLNLSASDPGADSITGWLITWGDGNTSTVGNVASATHTYADGANSWTISATATDEDGTFAAGNTVAVTVDNVDPTLTISGAGSVQINTLYTLNLSSSDPGADTISSWLVNWGDGPAELVAGNPSSVTHTYTTIVGSPFTVSATATDEDDTYNSNSLSVTVTNIVAPTLGISGAATAVEGDDYSLTLTSSSALDNWTIQWGDGSPVETVAYTGSPMIVTHEFRDGLAISVVSATGNVGIDSYPTSSVSVTVSNAAPVPEQIRVEIGGANYTTSPVFTVPGLEVNFVVSASDPAFDDVDAPFQFLINFGDGNTATATMTQEDDEVVFTHAYLTTSSNPAGWQPTLVVTDADGLISAVSNLTKVIVSQQALIEGVLYVGGGDAPSGDRIVAQASGSTVRIRIGGVLLTPVTVTGGLVVYGNGGNDTVTITGNLNMPVEFYGGPGDDYLAGGRMNDILDGGAGRDRIIGGLGDDVLLGGPGNDTLNGSAGNDIIFGDHSVLFVDGEPQIQVVGATVTGIIEATGANAGNDNLNGDAGEDRIYGGEGSDFLTGGTGNDLMRGGDGNDRMQGGNDNDILLGDGGADNLQGQAGRDILIGGLGTDILSGGAANDLLFGGDVPDSFINAPNVGGNNSLAELWVLWQTAQESSAMDLLEDYSAADSGALDSLHGESGSDWYLMDTGDVFKLQSETKLPNQVRIR